MHVGGGRDDVFDVYWDPFEPLLVEIRDEDGVSVGDDEECAGVVVGFAGVFVCSELVTVDAAAEV